MRLCGNLVPDALEICAIVRKNSAIVRKFGTGRVRGSCDFSDKLRDCAKIGPLSRSNFFATARKTVRFRGNLAPVALEICAIVRKTSGLCANLAPSALELCAIVRKTARLCGNTVPVALEIRAIVRKTVRLREITLRLREHLDPVASEIRAIVRKNWGILRKFGPCRVWDLRDCAKKLRGCAQI